MLQATLEELAKKPICGIALDVVCSVCKRRPRHRSNYGMRLKSCLHEVCRDCIMRATNKATMGFVPCPHEQCGIAITELEIRTVCGEAAMDRVHQIAMEHILGTGKVSRNNSGPTLLDSLVDFHSKRLVECSDSDGWPCQICGFAQRKSVPQSSVVRLQSCLHEICRLCIAEHADKCSRLPVKCPFEQCEAHVNDCELKAICSTRTIERLEKLSLELAIPGSSDVRVESVPTSRPETFRNLEHAYAQNLYYCEFPIECPICFDTVAGSSERDSNRGIRLMSCLHELCRNCLKGWIEASDDPHVVCPIEGCACLISEREMRASCCDKTIRKLHHMSVTRAAPLEGEFVAICYTKSCAGIVMLDEEYRPGKDKSGGPIFECPVCRKENCLSCQTQHPGMDCKQHREGINRGMTEKANWKLVKEDADRRIKAGLAMLCPRCSTLIEKISGCDGIVCTICKLQICWATKKPRWGPGGAGDTSGGCGCSPYKRCHPNCKNCH